jgi:hypothetical protein
MIRTAIIAGGLFGLGILAAAPAMAAPDSTVSCSPPAICANQAVTAPLPGLLAYYTGTGPGTAIGDFTTAWTTGPATAIGVWQQALVGG